MSRNKAFYRRVGEKVGRVFLPLGFVVFSAQPAVAGDEIQPQVLVPAQVVQESLKEYSPQESELIKVDLNNIRSLCFRGITPAEGQKHYIATAGAPGAGKSTILETHMRDTLQGANNYVYVDPDQRALKFMVNTYAQDFTVCKIAAASSFKTLSQKAYDKWRGGSIYIANVLLNEASEGGFNIAQGVTSTGAHISNLYKGLKKKGYKITLLFCGAEDKKRVAALEHRVKTQCFCQVDPMDVMTKGEMFFQRFPDYFQYADEIYLYWLDDLQKGAVLGGKLIRGQKPEILNKKVLKKFAAHYNKTLKDKNSPTFEALMGHFSSKP